MIDLDRRLTVTREEAGARVPHENQAQGVRGGNDASGLVILVWDCPSAQRRAGLRRAAGLLLPLPLLLRRSSYFWPLGIVPPSRDQAEVICSSSGKQGHGFCSLDFGAIPQQLVINGGVHRFEGAVGCGRYQNARCGLWWALMVSPGGL